jgi:hypothetical protein
MASMAAHTYKGNVGTVLAAPSDLTQAQLTADLNPCTAALKGMVPVPPGDPTQFLNGNCLFTGLSPMASLTVTGATSIGGQTSLTNTTNSTSPTTGAVQIAGGLGVQKNLYVGGNVSTGPLTVTTAFNATGLVTNTDLVNASTIVNGQPCTLGSTCSTSSAILPTNYGCIGNGVADDTVCMQTAITAAETAPASGLLFDATHLYKISGQLNISSPLKIQGTWRQAGFQANQPSTAACTAGIHVSAANVTLFNITASGVVIDGLCVDYKGISNTSGATFYAVGALGNDLFSNNSVTGACITYEISGVSNTQNNVGFILENNNIVPTDSAGCYGIRIGHQSTGAFTTEVHMSHNETYCPTASNTIGLQIEDGGGIYVGNGDGRLACRIGTRLIPGNNQLVQDFRCTGCTLGDSDTLNDFVIDTSGSSGVVSLTQITGAWSGSASGGPSVLLQSNGGGGVAGTHFSGDKIYPLGQNNNIGLYINDPNGHVNYTTIDNSTICSRVSNTSYQVIVNTAGYVAMRGNTVGYCDNILGGQAASLGVNYDPPGAGGGFVFTGNVLIGISGTLLNYAPGALTPAIITDNLNLDTAIPTISSASSITLGLNPTVTISGTATINTATPVWTGRRVTVIPTGNYGTSSGVGNMGTVTTASAGIPQVWIFNGTQWNVK